MAKALFTNNAAGTLSASVASSNTLIYLGAGQGALFPTITGSDYFYITVTMLASPYNKEIMKVTAVSTDTFTVSRGQDNTVANASGFAISDPVELRVTAKVLQEIQSNLVGGLGGQIPYQSAGDTTTMLANGTPGQYLTSQGTTLPPLWVTTPTDYVLQNNGSMSIGSFALLQYHLVPNLPSGMDASVSNLTILIVQAGGVTDSGTQPPGTSWKNVSGYAMAFNVSSGGLFQRVS